MKHVGTKTNGADIVTQSQLAGTRYVAISTASQVLPAAARTYIVGSGLTIPAGSLVAGFSASWELTLTKTAAGVAASTYDIAIGTLGTTGDAAHISFTKPAGTAVVDEAKVYIKFIVQSVGASGIAVGNFHLSHNLSATGHAKVPNVVVTNTSATFNTTTVTKIGICATTGAADAITVKMCSSEGWSI